MLFVLPLYAQDFWEVVASGDRVKAEEMLEEGVDVDEYNDEEETALTIAIKNKNLEMVQLLLEYEAQVSDDDFDLSFQMSKEIAILFMKRKVKSCDALMTAAYEGNATAAQNLLDEGYEVDAVNDDDRTALMFAKTKEVVTVLLENGADIDHQDSEDKTALLLAIEEGNEEVFTTLIQRGANIHLMTSAWETSIEIAIDHGRSHMEKILVEKGANKWTPLMVAAYKGDLAQVKQLLAQGENPKARSEEEETALLICVQKQWNQQVFDTLLEAGADINEQDLIEYNVLMNVITELENPEEAVQYIVTKGIDVNAENDEGFSAMQLAIDYEKWTAIEALLNNGKTGWTKLMVACCVEDFDEVEQFISPQEVNKKNNLGQTALMLTQSTEIAEMLLQNNALVNAKDSKGETALMYACKVDGNEDMVDFLLENGAEINGKSTDGTTAFRFAIRKKSYSVFMHLLDHEMQLSKEDVNAAMQYAITNESTDAIDKLIEQGADINYQKSWMDDTPMFFAIREKSPAMIRYLVEKGVDLNPDSTKEVSMIATSGKNPLFFCDCDGGC